MIDINNDWKFELVDKLENGHLFEYDELKMRDINVPHDYSIEQPMDWSGGSDGCVGYARGGLAWYRKHLHVDSDILYNKKVFINFDGIYNRSHIYFNEQLVTFHPYGYSPCLIDVTPYLKEGDNLLAVYVDHSRACDSRWYTGSGIYRKVTMHVLPKTYIPVWGARITTECSSSQFAKVNLSMDFVNELDYDKSLRVVTSIISPTGDFVTEVSSEILVSKIAELKQTAEITNPMLWGIYQGHRYVAITKVFDGDYCIQSKETVFGIRYFHFDVDEGFFLNGNNELIKGVCLHHDAGLVGSAIPNDVLRRRLEMLIKCGTNAIRTAHNPYSADFFDLCDEYGLLVQEEFYDEWDFPKGKKFNQKETLYDYKFHGHDEFFREYAKEDLQNVIRRDFNHPCIIQWSIGNEIEWTYPKYNNATGYWSANAGGGYFFSEPPYSVAEIREICSKLPKEHIEVGKTAKMLAQWTREMDTTRPIIANCILPSASYESGYVDALDMVGFSYRRIVYDRSHQYYPDKAIMGTENVGQWHEWKAVLERPFISGIFLWTGIDYVGECGGRKHQNSTARISPSGLIDVTGFDHPSFHMFKALWRENEPELFIATNTLEKSVYDLKDGKLVQRPGLPAWDRRLWSWQDMNNHFNYKLGEDVVIEVYSNCEEVDFYQNDELICHQFEAENVDRIYKCSFKYKGGQVKVVGIKNGQAYESILQEALPATDILISVDKTEISANFDSVVHVVAQLKDKNGLDVNFQDEEIEFLTKSEDGVIRFLGVDNGSPMYQATYKNPKIQTNRGRALMIIGANRPGIIKVCATIKGSLSNVIDIHVLE
ncbi:MAG: hypothetical protein ATN31_08765 [Candidatus Epulonipiscioides saccharophilum]|nr:MAG: hypothetical protein ATN31_08765 [Epulopiscium sp. AS2M-Bin001]